MPKSAGKQHAPDRQGTCPAGQIMKRNNNVTRHSSPIDYRPFQPKAKLENQQALVSRYGEIAIAEVADALHHLKSAERQPRITARAA